METVSSGRKSSRTRQVVGHEKVLIDVPQKDTAILSLRKLISCQSLLPVASSCDLRQGTPDNLNILTTSSVCCMHAWGTIRVGLNNAPTSRIQNS